MNLRYIVERLEAISEDLKELDEIDYKDEIVDDVDDLIKEIKFDL